MARTTRKQVEALFAQLASALDTTDYALDFYGVGGGYMILGRHDGNQPGATPFGSRRRPAGQMADALRFALDALQLEDRLNRADDDQAYRRGVEDCAEKWPYYEELLS